MVIYTTYLQYLESATSIKAKIDIIDTIIISMLGAMAKSALTGHFDEYRMDDGQVKIETVYRDPKSLTVTIKELENLKQLYLNIMEKNMNGRVMRLVDISHFRN